MGVVQAETKLRISGPIRMPFTPNPMHELSLDSPKLKKRGWKAWAGSKPRRYWVFLGLVVLFFLMAIAAAIIVLLYFIAQHRGAMSSVALPQNNTQISEPVVHRFPATSSSSAGPDGVTSYLIDVMGADDEDTRVIVW
jgi:hypothetical protein